MLCILPYILHYCFTDLFSIYGLCVHFTTLQNEVLEWDEDGVGDKVANNLIRFLG